MKYQHLQEQVDFFKFRLALIMLVTDNTVRNIPNVNKCHPHDNERIYIDNLILDF